MTKPNTQAAKIQKCCANCTKFAPTKDGQVAQTIQDRKFSGWCWALSIGTNPDSLRCGGDDFQQSIMKLDTPPLTRTVFGNPVAQVGWTGSMDDVVRLAEVEAWCKHHNYVFPSPCVQDPIQINKGRDFLKEDKTYSVVILHFIFRGGGWGVPDNHPELAISTMSSWSAWRKRLVSTQAKLIFAFGGPAEVGGSYIVNLDGYSAHKIRDETLEGACNRRSANTDGLWVFERIE